MVVWGQLWDGLACGRQWKWAGHTVRSGVSVMLRAFFHEQFHSDVLAYRLKRKRTGPDNSGMRPVNKFLESQGLSLETAWDRELWRSLLGGYQAFWGVSTWSIGRNIFYSSAEVMAWSRKCLQGTVYGSMTMFVRRELGWLVLSSLHRARGWEVTRADVGSDVPTVQWWRAFENAASVWMSICLLYTSDAADEHRDV